MTTQITAQQFSSKCKRAYLYVENDMPVGELHDFVLSVKGHLVDLMVKLQKEEQAMSDQQKKMEAETSTYCSD